MTKTDLSQKKIKKVTCFETVFHNSHGITRLDFSAKMLRFIHTFSTPSRNTKVKRAQNRSAFAKVLI